MDMTHLGEDQRELRTLHHVRLSEPATSPANDRDC